MKKLQIKRGTNIWLTKEYLQRFYTVEKPEWVEFCELLMNNNYNVFLYLSKKTKSVYLSIVKNRKMVKIRFSDHTPNFQEWLKGDIDFCLGDKRKGMLSKSEVLDILNIYFR